MQRTKTLSIVVLCALAGAVAACAVTQPPATQVDQAPQASAPHAGAGTGTFRTLAFTNTGSLGNPYMGQLLFNNAVSKIYPQHVTTNGRSCATCHVGADGFGLDAKTANAKLATDPLIAQVMADADGDLPAGVNSLAELKVVLLDQLRTTGMIRIVKPLPNQPDVMMRTFRAVPTVFNAALGIEEDHPTSAGGNFRAFTMWDGREPSLEMQAGSATMGHAQGKLIGGGDLRAFLDGNGATNDIAAFEKTMLSQPLSLANLTWQRPERNTALDGTIYAGAPVFETATVQQKFFSTVKLTTDAQRRGLKVFTGTPNKPACIVCHNMPETLAGGTELFTDARVAHENTQPRLRPPTAKAQAIMERMGFAFLEGGLVQQLPTQDVQLKDAAGTLHVVKTQDAGLAAQTGRYEDLHKFKTSQLRGISQFNRFFHDNHERGLDGVVHHYMDQFPELFPFTPQEENDLLEFLKVL